jgi:hypothetical protein
MKRKISIRELLKEQSINIALNLTLIIMILMRYTRIMAKGSKFLIVSFFIFIICILLVNLTNKFFIKRNLFDDVLDEKHERRYMRLIIGSLSVLVFILTFGR